MKNKILLVLITSILIITTLTGCNKIKLKDNPSTDAPVTSNGGLVVQKGEYLYFSNGYQSYKNLENGDNKYGKVKYSAIYRAKTNDGELCYETTYNDENEEEKNLTNVELLIPKVVSNENGNFFIFDDYIYYGSPTTEKDKTGDSRFDLVTFFVCNINGTGTTKLLATNHYGTGSKFNMIKIDGKLYLEIYDGESITIATIKDKKVEDTKVIEGHTFTDVIFPTEDTYNAKNNIVDANKGYVYYTRKADNSEKETNNLLCKVDIKVGKEEILVNEKDKTITLKDYHNGYLFYTVQFSANERANYYLYATPVDEINSNIARESDTLSYIDAENYYVIKSMQFIGAIVSNNNGIYACIKGESQPRALVIGNSITTSDSTDTKTKYTILAVDTQYVYAYDSNGLIRFDIEKSFQAGVDLVTMEGLYFDSTIKFDICGDHVYYFNTYEGDNATGYYLNRTKISNPENTAELLGVLDSKHIKTETEE